MKLEQQGYTRRTFEGPLGNASDSTKATLTTHTVYEKAPVHSSAGPNWPVVIIIQELPGIGPETLALADQFIENNFRVVIPHLFGPIGRTSLLGNTVRVLCMRREFKIFESNKTSPVISWLRALCADVKQRNNVPGVGVIGMCLTGNFAISLMADDAVLGGVASQPSLAIKDQQSLHMSEQDVADVRRAIDAKGDALAYRFDGDPLCTAQKFNQYQARFNDDAPRIKLVTLPGKGHSVLTLDFVDEEGHPTREALDSVLNYFSQRLG